MLSTPSTDIQGQVSLFSLVLKQTQHPVGETSGGLREGDIGLSVLCSNEVFPEI